MTLVRLNPNRLFRDFERWLGPSEEASMQAFWAPAVDIYQQDGDIVLKAELPGVDPKEVSLTLDHNVLTLRGERRAEQEAKDGEYHRQERWYGAFSRSFTLSTPVERDKITATYKDGVLRVVVPQKAEARPRQIEVKTAA